MSHTPVTYGRKEVAAIVAQLRSNVPPTCPRCEVELEEAEPKATGGIAVFEACCPRCLHCLFLRRDQIEPAGG